VSFTDTDHLDAVDKPADDQPADLPQDASAEQVLSSSGEQPDVVAEADAGQQQDSLSATDPQVPRLRYVDPGELVIGANVRTDPALDKALVGSIGDRGVREPITVRAAEDGSLVVVKGQRRTRAAVEAGLESVLVLIETGTAMEGSAREIDRIVDQLGENQHRLAISDIDEIRAHQQLTAFGLRAGQIARRTRTKLNRVKTNLTVAGSEAATAAMASYDLRLDQAAVIADFDGDTEAVSGLIAAARVGPGRFEHVAQQVRDARTETARREELTAQLTAANVRVIDRPDPAGSDTTRPLGQLRPDADAPSGTAIEPGAHTDCAGHVAWLDHSWATSGPEVVYGCEKWAAHGHAQRWAPPGHTSVHSAAGRSGGRMSEEQRSDRAQVIANNKAWISATTVRLDWLKKWLTRKTPPKDAASWIATAIADGSHDLRRAMEDQHSLARDLLGLADTDNDRWYRGCGRPHPIAAAASATPARATTLMLAMLLGAMEAGTSKDTWRSPSTESRTYLSALQHWGYDLSEVEQLALTTGTDHTERDAPADGDPDDSDNHGQEHPEDRHDTAADSEHHIAHDAAATDLAA
jgi:ParB family transcriptional regulator, chromosome partitioning protein